MSREETASFIGIDLGTSGVRTIVIDRGGRQLAGAEAPLSGKRTPGTHTQDPQAWWTALVRAMRDLPGHLRRNARALGIDGTSGSVLLCDTDGSPHSPALMYDDGRGSEWLDRIRQLAPAGSPTRSTGGSLARLLYLAASTPQRGPVRLALNQADWISGRLRDRFGDSDENNVLKLGYDVLQRSWPAWLHKILPEDVLLPRVHPVGKALGSISASVARELGLPETTEVAAGTTDSNAAVLAAGACQPGDAVTSLGSTLVLKVISPRPVFDEGCGIYSHRLGELWLSGGASNSGGAALLRYFSRDEIARLTPLVDPARSCELDYYPLPGIGERFPQNDPTRQSRVEPVPDDPACRFQAMLEGIAAIERAGYRRLAELGAPYPERVFSAGGGAANRAWGKIRAGLLGVPETPARHTAAAYGAALLARDACGN